MDSDRIKREIEQQERELKNKEDYIKRYSSEIVNCEKVIDRKLNEMQRTTSDYTFKTCQQEIERQRKAINNKQSDLSRYQKDAVAIQAKINKLNKDYNRALKEEAEEELRKQKEEQERQRREAERQRDQQQRELQRQKEEAFRAEERHRKELADQQKEAELQRKKQQDELDRQRKEQEKLERQLKMSQDTYSGQPSGYYDYYEPESNHPGCFDTIKRSARSFAKVFLIVIAAYLVLGLLGGKSNRNSNKNAPYTNLEQTTVQEDSENNIVGYAEVVVDELYIRSMPSTEGNKPKRFAEQKKMYEVFDIYYDGQLTWYKVGDEEWFADDDGKWVRFTPIGSNEEMEEPSSNTDFNTDSMVNIRDVPCYLGLRVEDIIAEYGTSYNTEYLSGSQFMYYDGVPYAFAYYDYAADMRDDLTPQLSDVIFGVTTLLSKHEGYAISIIGPIKIGSTIKELEDYLGYKVTLDDVEGTEGAYKLTIFEQDGIKYIVYCSASDEEIVGVTCGSISEE